MKKIVIYLCIVLSMLISVPKVVAWSDGVEGALMPEARGGGGISEDEAQSAMYGPEEGSPADQQALVEWE